MAVSTPQLVIICTGSVKDRNLGALIADYHNRLHHDARITVHEVKDSTKRREGDRIIALLKKEGGHSFALTEEGTLQSSRQLARRLETIPGKTVFIIGGPEGLDTTVKTAADDLFSLSPLTFTHEIARFLLFEQLYRACSILHNRQYHKD
jgi:23S rRNA (pseudouridine1915-N3)-methyltransferase